MTRNCTTPSRRRIRCADRIAFSSEEIERAIETLMLLANLRADHGDSIPDFIDNLVRSMERDRRKELHLEASAQAQFKKNLTILLAVKNLIVASKAIYLRRDYEHTYCRTRILTDIRPIFEEDRTLPPVNALIVHTLQLVYHEGSGTKEIHIALDVENLSSLKVQIERAEEKTKSLKTLLAKVKLPTILD